MHPAPANKRPNRLIHSTSPYLLQHAYNPVDWFEWGPEAHAKAIQEGKPILVSIGYSSCHWCHVMERESFEVDDIARIMNDHFVCIKVDREERPDVDHVYMEAVQAMGTNGGWPLNVFLTPDRKPFYGGTYYPPQNWGRLLLQIHKAFGEKRKEIEESSQEISQHLKTTDLQRFGQRAATATFTSSNLKKMDRILEDRYDAQWGGMDKAPKFVMPTIWLFLLRRYAVSGNTQALQMVTHTLAKMSDAGLYDQLGGGFSRYSVDKEWFAPHFEKMLYDNAQLLSLYAEAYSITHDVRFREIVFETVGWLTREMADTEGGFYSALDADSEGVEGKFYTWTLDEIRNVLHDKTEPFARFNHITKEGNWEHGRNILRRSGSETVDLTSENKKLLAARDLRVRPGLDDKILAGWNAMTLQGLIDAYRAFKEQSFLELAERNIRFIEMNLIHEGKLFRSFKNKRSTTEGFLEDYAFLVRVYISLYQATFREEYIRSAQAWCEYLLENFLDAEDGYFHFSGKHAEELIARKKELFDNVIPSSNSVVARNLYHLGILLDRQDWRTMAEEMVSRLLPIIQSEPAYMSNWGILLAEMVKGMAEVVIVGPKAAVFREELSSRYLPFALLMGTESTSGLPLFEGRGATDGKTRIYVCFNKMCKLPVESVEDALKQYLTPDPSPEGEGSGS